MSTSLTPVRISLYQAAVTLGISMRRTQALAAAAGITGTTEEGIAVVWYDVADFEALRPAIAARGGMPGSDANAWAAHVLDVR